uniref:Lysosomal-associated membrane protein 2 n=1 Tax=Neolamprologus brichardi TaxID=32507 RepID=A0A3Q4GXH2_NEOBR
MLSILLFFPVFQLSHGIEFNVTKDGKLCLYANLELTFSVTFEDLDNLVSVFVLAITGNYSIKTENGTVCLLANFGLRIGFKGEEMNLNPNMATVSGSCGVNSSELLLASKEMTIKQCTEKKANYVLSFFLEGNFSVENSSLNLWEASIGSSYMCNKEQTFNITDTLSLYTFSLHVQPFGVKKGVFSTAEECLADGESFLVPIAVGVALLVLILIVLLAYFIGRRRSMATGYQSF